MATLSAAFGIFRYLGSNPTGTEFVPLTGAADQNSVTRAWLEPIIASIYSTTEGRAALDAMVARGEVIDVIDQVALNLAGGNGSFFALRSSGIAPDGLGTSGLALDPAALVGLTGIDGNGQIVQVTPAAAVAHELGHIFLDLGDPVDNSRDPGQSQIASGIYYDAFPAGPFALGIPAPDYLGPVERFANAVAEDLGIPPWRAGYYGFNQDSFFRSIRPNGNFTNGQQIDVSISAQGTIVDTTIIDSRDLIISDILSIGLNIFNVGGGNDFVYGLQGTDEIDLGAGDDFGFGGVRDDLHPVLSKLVDDEVLERMGGNHE